VLGLQLKWIDCHPFSEIVVWLRETMLGSELGGSELDSEMSGNRWSPYNRVIKL
jgi:hypothetical protein